MCRILFACLTVIGMTVTAHAQQKQNMNSIVSDQRILVVYFSATGTTAAVAEKVAAVTGGKLHALVPAQPYTRSDLDWTNAQSRSSLEMNNPKARPALEGATGEVADYAVIFLGYPIWWDMAPRIVNTFLESQDLRGKVVIPFATSGSSGIANSAAVLKKTYPEIKWENGRLLNHATENTIREWIEQLGY